MASASSSAPAPFAVTPFKWLQIGSRDNLAAARLFAAKFGEEVRIFRTSNEWYAITAALLHPNDYADEGIERMIKSEGWPSDSFLTEGKSYLEVMARVDGQPPPPVPFTHTYTLRKSMLYDRSGLNGRQVYHDLKLVREGTAVTVWGQPDKLGDCGVDGHEGIFMKCADLAAFATPTPPEDYLATYRARDGDAFVERLIQTTRWENSEEQRVYLGLLVWSVVSKDPEMDTPRKASVLMAALHDLAVSAGGDGDLIRTMNYVRNTRQGPATSYTAVTAPDSGWEMASRGEKEFHIIGIADPADVEKYVRADGREAVFLRDPSTGTWEVMADGTNDATYNLVPFAWNKNDFWQHMVLDVVPWLLYGVSPEDKTDFARRIQAFEQSGAMSHLTKIFGAIPNPLDEIAETLERLPPNSMVTGPLQALLNAGDDAKVQPSPSTADATSQQKIPNAEASSLSCVSRAHSDEEPYTSWWVVRSLERSPPVVYFTPEGLSEKGPAIAIPQLGATLAGPPAEIPHEMLNRSTARALLERSISAGIFLQGFPRPYEDLRLLECAVRPIASDIAEALRAPTPTDALDPLSRINAWSVGGGPLNEGHLDQMRFVLDLGYPALGLYPAGKSGRLDEELRIFDIEYEEIDHIRDAGGVLIGLIEVEQITGLLASETQAEIEFSLRAKDVPASTLEQAGIVRAAGMNLNRARSEGSQLGFGESRRLYFTSGGNIRSVNLSETFEDRNFTAILRLYDSGWRLYDIRS